MKSFIFIFIISIGLIAPKAYCAFVPENSLIVLDKALAEVDTYEGEKKERIKKLEHEISASKNQSVQQQFDLNMRLYEEYSTYNYEAAFSIILDLESIARKMKDPVRIEYVKMRLGFILLSSGLFKEAFDSFKAVNSKGLPDSLKSEYYALQARAYYGLSDYNKDNYYSHINRNAGSRYIDSALMIIPSNAYEYLYLKGLRAIKENDHEAAKAIFKNLLSDFHLDYHQFAIATSTLSDLYINIGDDAIAIDLLAKAAIADIKSSTRETTAILNLARLLNEQGDVERAYTYIKRASEDAEFYGARQRKIQVSAILPIIAGLRLDNSEAQKRVLIFYSSIITLLSVLVIVFAIIIYKQVKKLKRAEKTIVASNESLKKTNLLLLEANRIKERYIAYYFNTNFEYIEKLRRLKTSMEQKIQQRKLDDLSYAISKIDLKHEREQLFQGFDKIFLSLFPDFIAEFNSYFKEEDQIILEDQAILNTELRIFALIRMGINDNDKIARILGYSVNTIYTYKTRIKNKALVKNELFEEMISISGRV